MQQAKQHLDKQGTISLMSSFKCKWEISHRKDRKGERCALQHYKLCQTIVWAVEKGGRWRNHCLFKCGCLKMDYLIAIIMDVHCYWVQSNVELLKLEKSSLC